VCGGPSLFPSPVDTRHSLKSRHIQFIALGGTIGTGLFLGIGRAFTQAGPLSVLLGYTFTGIAVFAMMQCLGEMATWLPLPGAIPQFCARYVDDAVGFAVGWNVSGSKYQSLEDSLLTESAELVFKRHHSLRRNIGCLGRHSILARCSGYQCCRMDLHHHRCRLLPQHLRRCDLW
jgi:hypothetical protein